MLHEAGNSDVNLIGCFNGRAPYYYHYHFYYYYFYYSYSFYYCYCYCITTTTTITTNITITTMATITTTPTTTTTTTTDYYSYYCYYYYYYRFSHACSSKNVCFTTAKPCSSPRKSLSNAPTNVLDIFQKSLKHQRAAVDRTVDEAAIFTILGPRGQGPRATDPIGP